MAGFEVTPYGRFCLTPEDPSNLILAGLTEGVIADLFRSRPFRESCISP